VRRVRPGTTGDIAGLLDIEDEFRRAGTAAWSLMDERWFARKVAQEEIFVADDEGIIGYLMWTTLWRLPWIEFVRVRAARRRQGVGTALVRALEEQLRAANGYMLVSSSTGSDEAAIAWHRAVGFEDGGRIEWRMWPGAPPEVLHYKEL
jgi:ribosomal protein S18 acetylase RimI-like enzyme